MSTDTPKPQEAHFFRLRDALKGLEELVGAFNAPDLVQRIWEAREPLDRGELWIVVVGQFKRGKSTLLNALLDDRVLPSGLAPVTSVVTHIRWAQERGLRVTFMDGTERSVPLSEIGVFVAEEGNPGNRRGVLKVEVGLPSPLLEGGGVMVDTPGIGSLDSGATERAYAFLPRVDAAVVVLSPDPPLGDVERSFLQALLAHTDHLLIVLNKIDLFPDEAWQEALAFNRRELGRILAVAPETIEVLPVSAAHALDGEGGGISTLRDRLLDLVRERGEEVSRVAALRRLRVAAGEFRGRLQVEEKAIRLSDAGLEARLTQLTELRRELAARRQEVRPVLLEATRRLVESATASLRDRATDGRESIAGSLRALVEAKPVPGNAALVRAVSEELFRGVSAVFDSWWGEHDGAVRGRLKDAMSRTAKGVDATGSTLSQWVNEELGVILPAPPPPLDLVDSHDFYYHVQGMRPELTVDMLQLLLPRGIFRRLLRSRIPRLVAQDLELNVGRIRGDLLYRAQETVRGFFAELERRAVEAEDGIETALARALRVRAEERDKGAAELDRLAGGLQTLEDILAGVEEEPSPGLAGGRGNVDAGMEGWATRA